jgi:hypothetical protein
VRVRDDGKGRFLSAVGARKNGDGGGFTVAVGMDGGERGI